ncbi:MAG: transcriptional repressor NrdR [Clostridia bacterium]|nr:transcriptional repressor NrdR [Clostridia bacterium]
MKCIFCGSEENKVLDSRDSVENNSIRRRRECLKCHKRFTTYETIETTPILVVKNDGTRQPFDANKIKQGIIKSCEKRPVTMVQIDKIVDDIEKQVSGNLDKEVKSSEIGELVMAKLKAIDEISYIRFASVYRKFTDVTHFVNFINDFEKMLKNE